MELAQEAFEICNSIELELKLSLEMTFKFQLDKQLKLASLGYNTLKCWWKVEVRFEHPNVIHAHKTSILQQTSYYHGTSISWNEEKVLHEL